MKFITEQDLRDLYQTEPFTNYQIESGARLTPGARTFLADRGINLFEDGSSMNLIHAEEEPAGFHYGAVPEPQGFQYGGTPGGTFQYNREDDDAPKFHYGDNHSFTPPVHDDDDAPKFHYGDTHSFAQLDENNEVIQEERFTPVQETVEPVQDSVFTGGGSENKENVWKKKKLYSKIQSDKADFLIAGQNLLTRDISLAQEVMELGKKYAQIQDVLAGKPAATPIPCTPCGFMNESNFSKDIGDCVEITELYMQLEKGREILFMHKLRCSLRETEALILELIDDQKVCNDADAHINRTINTLSQMICGAIGRKECHRKQ